MCSSLKISAIFLGAILEVVDGYNVYNQIGLSVFDNLNVKHWAAIKKAAGTIHWDSKPLTEYNIIKEGDGNAPVANVVLHSNITIDPDDLPDSYFRKATDDGYSTVNNILQTGAKIPDSVKNYLEGPLKDGLTDHLPHFGHKAQPLHRVQGQERHGLCFPALPLVALQVWQGKHRGRYDLE